MNWHRVLLDGTVLSVLGSLLILGSLLQSPRLWLQDFPRDIRDAVPPKTPQEKRAALAWGIPYLLALVAVPAVSCVLLRRESAGTASFAALFLNAFGVLFLFNLVDLIVIDWLLVCGMTPRFVVIPGTEGAAGYKDYLHHFRGFVIGTIASALVALLIAAAVRFV